MALFWDYDKPQKQEESGSPIPEGWTHGSGLFIDTQNGTLIECQVNSNITDVFSVVGGLATKIYSLDFSENPEQAAYFHEVVNFMETLCNTVDVTDGMIIGFHHHYYGNCYCTLKMEVDDQGVYVQGIALGDYRSQIVVVEKDGEYQIFDHPYGFDTIETIGDIQKGKTYAPEMVEEVFDRKVI